MTINRRSVLCGMLASAAGLGLGLSVKADTESVLIGHDINVQEAMDLSHNKVILHCGQDFNADTLQALKYAIEEIGIFEVDVYGGGPPDMLTSYVYGHNYPGRHYSAEEALDMVQQLQQLADMHAMALEPSLTP